MQQSSLAVRVSVAFSIALAGCASPPHADESGVTAAWVQAAAGGTYSVRALTDAATCPLLLTDRGSLRMTLRAPPAEIAPRGGAGAQPDTRSSRFEQRSCEATVPTDAGRIAVGGRELPLPRREIRRIVLIGDTGCRMKQSEDAFQDCHDAARWPFAAVARAAAAWHPDLVVHVGDLHYRESPCPAGRAGCAGSPWGYGSDAWRADFFEPAAALLAAAPWVFVRGNHENCSRAGVGWFRYLDGHPWRPVDSCERPQDDTRGDFSAPYTVPVSADTQLLVFDSAFVRSRAYAGGDAALARYVEQLRQVDALVGQAPHTIFLSHHPVLAFGGSASGAPKASGGGLRSALAQLHPQRLYAPGVDLVVNGHVHLFEALDFSSAHPAELLVGNGGSAMEGTVDAAQVRGAEPAPGAVVRSFVTQPGYGYATLERSGAGWLMTEWNVRGEALQVCRLAGARWDCDARP